MSNVVRAERPGSTPTITRPDLDRDQDVKPKALLPYKVVVLDWPTMHTSRMQAPASPTPTITRPDVDRDQDVKPKALRPHKVIVLDCNCHTFDDVEIALCRVIPGMTRQKAHEHAWEIHTTG